MAADCLVASKRKEAPVYKKLDESMGNVLGYKISGTLSKSEVEEIAAEIEKTLADTGTTVNLLLEFGSLDEAPDAWYDDLTFSSRFYESIGRMALVAAPEWETWWVKFAGLFVLTESKFFPPMLRSQAVAWIRKKS